MVTARRDGTDGSPAVPRNSRRAGTHVTQRQRQGDGAFIEAFDPEHRAKLEAAAEQLELQRGDYLLRRGDPGGDVFLLVDGTLEVVDSRSTPQVIVSVITPGQMVGDMAFVDDSPRSADVRAGLDAQVLRWTRDDLRSLLGRDPALAARFYEVIARLASVRLRRITDGAMSGSYASREQASHAGLQRTRDDARALAERVKGALLDLDNRLRQDATDEAAMAALTAVLDDLQASVAAVLLEHSDPEARRVAGELLGRELHPYLVRSSLAERCIRRPQGVTGAAEIMAHVFVDTAAGDGRLGELLDRWLLDRPTFVAMRALRKPTLAALDQLLPKHRNRRVLLINAGTGSLAAHMVEGLHQPPTVLTVVDQSREALAFLDPTMLDRRGTVQLQTVQENLGQLAMGRLRHTFPEQDAVVVHGLVEYLPERIAVSLLTVCRGLVRDSGAVLVSGLAPSDDQPLLDRLLEWPTVRRSEEALCNIFRAAGLEVVSRPPVPHPALLLAATPLAPG